MDGPDVRPKPVFLTKASPEKPGAHSQAHTCGERGPAVGEHVSDFGRLSGSPTACPLGAAENLTALICPAATALRFWNQKGLCRCLALSPAIQSRVIEKMDTDTLPPTMI